MLTTIPDSLFGLFGLAASTPHFHLQCLTESPCVCEEKPFGLLLLTQSKPSALVHAVRFAPLPPGLAY